jgi:hypothetical protein
LHTGVVVVKVVVVTVVVLIVVVVLVTDVVVPVAVVVVVSVAVVMVVVVAVIVVTVVVSVCVVVVVVGMQLLHITLQVNRMSCPISPLLQYAALSDAQEGGSGKPLHKEPVAIDGSKAPPDVYPIS